MLAASLICPAQGHTLTDLLGVLLGLQSDDLQDAGAGDVRNRVGHFLPDAQQRPAQHVVLPQPHALPALLPLSDQLALPVPEGETQAGGYSTGMEEPGDFLRPQTSLPS